MSATRPMDRGIVAVAVPPVVAVPRPVVARGGMFLCFCVCSQFEFESTLNVKLNRFSMKNKSQNGTPIMMVHGSTWALHGVYNVSTRCLHGVYKVVRRRNG